MNHWPASQLLKPRKKGRVSYRELARVPDLSLGVYILPAGATDRQTPHTEDEVYVVLAGRGRFRHGRRVENVGPGSVLFVPAGREHSFGDISEELRVAVIFAPAEYSREVRK
ncbi:MAG: cupin domain-containing protein [Thermoplasmata archaeon]|nr:cupin domain-containing protein [Thermoplasmata archaeon]